MKHILNNLTEEEKNSIREQHTGGIKVITENFNKLTNSKLGDLKPLVHQYSIDEQVSAPINKPTQSPQNFAGMKMCSVNSKGTLKQSGTMWYMVGVTDSKNTALPSCMLGKLGK
jgi:hypothetical protein